MYYIYWQFVSIYVGIIKFDCARPNEIHDYDDFIQLGCCSYLLNKLPNQKQNYKSYPIKRQIDFKRAQLCMCLYVCCVLVCITLKSSFNLSLRSVLNKKMVINGATISMVLILLHRIVLVL